MPVDRTTFLRAKNTVMHCIAVRHAFCGESTPAEIPPMLVMLFLLAVDKITLYAAISVGYISVMTIIHLPPFTSLSRFRVLIFLHVQSSRWMCGKWRTWMTKARET